MLETPTRPSVDPPAVPRVPVQPPNRRCIRLALTPGVTAARQGRQVVRDICATWELARLTDDAVAVASELITHAVLDGRAPITLTATQDNEHLTITLTDGGPRLPENVPADADHEYGNGLAIITALTHDWGTFPSSHGRTVWARLRVRPTPP